MSRRRTAVEAAPSTAERSTIRYYGEDAPRPNFVEEVEASLREGVAVEVWLRRDDDAPLFWLEPFHGVVHVVGAAGHCGTCASVAVAVSRGWEFAAPARPAVREARDGAPTVRRARRQRLKQTG